MELLAQVADGPIKIDWTQVSASGAIILIAVSWVIASIRHLSESRAEREKLTANFDMLVGRIHTEAKNERDANRQNLDNDRAATRVFIDRVCDQFDKTISEMHKDSEAARRAFYERGIKT